MAQKDFSEGGGKKRIFPGVAKNIFPEWFKSGKILFYPIETKKTTFFCQNFNR